MEKFHEFRKNKKLIKHYLQQILNGLAYCHQRRLFHRDLKPQNLLIDMRNNRVKIADFGLARTLDISLRPYTNEVVSLWYRPPEILLGSNYYGTSVDVWSIGCIFVEMITGKVLFFGKAQIEVILKIFHYLGTPNNKNWPAVTDLPNFSIKFPKWTPSKFKDFIQDINELEVKLLSRVLVLNPSMRVTVKDALGHTYFAENPST
jgi:cyclin-dependent kinase 2